MIAYPLRPETAYAVALEMRDADAREIGATVPHGVTRAGFAEACAACAPLAWGVCAADGKAVACIGVQRLWPGVWQAWMFATDRFDEIGIRLTRFARRSIMPAVKAAGAHRVQAYSIEGHETAHRWLERLGAVHEATLRGYGSQGEDFRLYRWHREA